MPFPEWRSRQLEIVKEEAIRRLAGSPERIPADPDLALPFMVLHSLDSDTSPEQLWDVLSNPDNGLGTPREPGYEPVGSLAEMAAASKKSQVDTSRFNARLADLLLASAPLEVLDRAFDNRDFSGAFAGRIGIPVRLNMVARQTFFEQDFTAPNDAARPRHELYAGLTAERYAIGEEGRRYPVPAIVSDAVGDDHYTVMWPGDIDLAEVHDVVAFPLSGAPRTDGSWLPAARAPELLDVAADVVRQSHRLSQPVFLNCERVAIEHSDPGPALARIQSALQPGAVVSLVLDGGVEQKLYNKNKLPKGTDVLFTDGFKREVNQVADAGEAAVPNIVRFDTPGHHRVNRQDDSPLTGVDTRATGRRIWTSPIRSPWKGRRRGGP